MSYNVGDVVKDRRTGQIGMIVGVERVDFMNVVLVAFGSIRKRFDPEDRWGNHLAHLSKLHTRDEVMGLVAEQQL